MKSILIIHQYFLSSNQGGGVRFNEFSKLWAQYGYKITVIAGMVHYTTGKKDPIYKGKFFYKELYENGIEVWRCHVSESYNKNFLGRLWGYVSFVVFGTFCALFKTKKKFDLILVTSPPLFVGIMALIVSKVKNIPIIFEVRDLWPESAIDMGVIKNPLIIKLSYKLEKIIYKNSTYINCLTPAFKKVLITEKGVPNQKVTIIPNAADFSIVEEVSQNFDVLKFKEQMGWNNKLVVLYVGAHGVANHLQQLIEAAALVQNYLNFLFVLVGDGMEKEKLKNMAFNRKLNNVHFYDTVPKKEVFKFILACDIGTSVLKKAETFKTVYSNKTFDYMACKKPILMAIDGISRNLVEEAQCGLYVEPENPNDFAQKLLYYYENPEMLKIHGLNGYLYVKQHFDRKVLAEKYLEIISSI